MTDTKPITRSISFSEEALRQLDEMRSTTAGHVSRSEALRQIIADAYRQRESAATLAPVLRATHAAVQARKKRESK